MTDLRKKRLREVFAEWVRRAHPEEAVVLAEIAVEIAAERVRMKTILRVPHGPDEDEAVRALALRLRHEADALDAIRRMVPVVLDAVARGQAQLRKSTVAHLQDALNVETGAVEVPLDVMAVTDLVHYGVTFTEAHNGEDILIKIVDTSGVLVRLRGLFEDYKATVGAESPS